MDTEEIWSHISRKISGEGTSEDIQQVEKWLSENTTNKKTYYRLHEIWNFHDRSLNKHHALFSHIKRRIVAYVSS